MIDFWLSKGKGKRRDILGAFNNYVDKKVGGGQYKVNAGLRDKE